MEKQKALLIELFTYLKSEDPEQAASDFLSPAEGAEPALDISALLGGAQEYARPILKPIFKKELAPEFKGQYMGEAINKIVAASKGKIRRADYDGDMEKALTDLANVLESKADKSEEAQTINELRQQVAALEQAKENEVNSLRSEFSQKEKERKIYDAILGKIGGLENPGEGKVGKKLTVAQDRAAKGLLRELSDDFTIDWDDTANDIVLKDKKDPNINAHVDNKPVQFNSVMTERLTQNNWIAQSNGGAAGKQAINVAQTFSRPDAGARGDERQTSDFRQRLEAQVLPATGS